MYMTRQRRELLTFFSNNPDKSFTAQEIAEQLSTTARFPVSISAVYRNLVMLEKEGYILRSPGEKPRESKYRFVHTDDCLNKLHLICEKCGNTIHLDEAAANRLIQATASTDGFTIDTNKTTIYGLCKKCK